MAYPSIPCTSPDISALSYSILYDISGAIPTLSLTNHSTVIHANNLKWWYVVTTPSGTPIHQGSLSSPDVNLVAWTTLNLPSNSWPLLFGQPPCAQIEFATGAPYICTLYVQDSASNVFSLAIQQTITRPGGNSSNSCGNFGQAAATVQVNCNSKNVFCADSTNMAYNGLIAPTSQSSAWTLVYPQDPAGNQPANGTASNTPYVNFPIGYSGDGYVLYLNSFATYDMGNGASIKVQFKAINPDTGAPGLPFAVLCNIDLCKLQCQIDAFYKLSKQKCGVLEDPALMSKMTRMNLLFNQAIIGILQPLCGIKVPQIIKEIQKIGDLDDNCNCGCTDTGINFSYPTGGPGGSGGCCPVSSNVIDKNTNVAPANCPQSYFPVNVFDPTATTIIGVATDIGSLVALLNSYPAWQAYGVAFAEGNCKIGWFALNGQTNIPDVKVTSSSGVIIPNTKVIIDIVIHGTNTPPPPCPGSFYPVKVYNESGTTVIGIATDITSLVSILNADPSWQAFGVASPQDNCHVQFSLTNAAVIPDNVQVDTNTTSTTCVNNMSTYTIGVSDICASAAGLQPSDFPINAYIDFGIGGGVVNLGVVASMAALINAYNTTSTKPPSVTFSAGSPFGTIIVTNTNCAAYSGTMSLTSDLGSTDFIFYGGNHRQMIATPPNVSALQAEGLRTSVLIGKVSGAAPAGIVPDEPLWHTIKIGKYLLVTSPVTVLYEVRVYDVTNPLMPVFVRAINLPDTGSGNCFLGLPNTITVASGGTPVQSSYGLYFITDNPEAMNINNIYVCEPMTGSMWKLDVLSTGSGVTASFADTRLLGKCPRVLANNKIFFTQDGDLEAAAGLSSGVTAGNIVELNLGTFSSGGLAVTVVMSSNPELIWAASFDGVDTIYFVSVSGTLVTFSVASNSPLVRYANAFSVANFRLNVKLYLTSLYATSLKFTAKTTGTQLLNTAVLPSIARTDFGNFTPTGGTVANNNSHYNLLPLGNCLVAVTYNNYADTGHPQGGIAIFKTTGAFVKTIQLVAGNIYNLIPFKPVTPPYTPTTLV